MDVTPRRPRYIVNPLTGRKVQFANLFSTTRPPPTASPPSQRSSTEPGPAGVWAPLSHAVKPTGPGSSAGSPMASARADDETPRAPRPESPTEVGPARREYVRFVERHRKLKFDHPVPVKFLADAAFVKAYQGDDPKISERIGRTSERAAGQLRALGLIEGQST